MHQIDQFKAIKIYEITNIKKDWFTYILNIKTQQNFELKTVDMFVQIEI